MSPNIVINFKASNSLPCCCPGHLDCCYGQTNCLKWTLYPKYPPASAATCWSGLVSPSSGLGMSLQVVSAAVLSVWVALAGLPAGKKSQVGPMTETVQRTEAQPVSAPLAAPIPVMATQHRCCYKRVVVAQ